MPSIFSVPFVNIFRVFAEEDRNSAKGGQNRLRGFRRFGSLGLLGVTLGFRVEGFEALG